MPKSTILTISSPSDVRCKNTFSGFRSRCDDARLVRSVEGAANLERYVHRARRGERAGRKEDLREVAALEQLHRDVEPTVLELSEVEHVDDVRMLDAARAHRFAMEANHHVRARRVLGLQDLQRDLLFDRLLNGSVHVAHAALAELAQHAVAARHELPDERVVQARRGLWQRRSCDLGSGRRWLAGDDRHRFSRIDARGAAARRQLVRLDETHPVFGAEGVFARGRQALGANAQHASMSVAQLLRGPRDLFPMTSRLRLMNETRGGATLPRFGNTCR